MSENNQLIITWTLRGRSFWDSDDGRFTIKKYCPRGTGNALWFLFDSEGLKTYRLGDFDGAKKAAWLLKRISEKG